jgi:hypothetical protein
MNRDHDMGSSEAPADELHNMALARSAENTLSPESSKDSSPTREGRSDSLQVAEDISAASSEPDLGVDIVEASLPAVPRRSRFWPPRRRRERESEPGEFLMPPRHDSGARFHTGAEIRFGIRR